MARETWVQSQVESYQRLKKWYLMPPCLTLSIIRYGSRVKWSNPGKAVAPFPTLWCSSYRKGSLRVTLEYGRQLYFYIYVIYFMYKIDKKRNVECWQIIQTLNKIILCRPCIVFLYVYIFINLPCLLLRLIHIQHQTVSPKQPNFLVSKQFLSSQLYNLTKRFFKRFSEIICIFHFVYL